jgi:hypothetical protein
MAEQKTIWHVIIDKQKRGPLTGAEVLKFLKDGVLNGGDRIWRPGFADWTPISEVPEFRQPPKRAMQRAPARPAPARPPGPSQADSASRSRAPKKWSIWRSANLGLLVSALMLIVQIASGRDFRLASYAQTASAATVGALLVQILAAPMLFALVALVWNLFRRGASRSATSATRGAITFLGLFACIVAGIIVYGKVFFSSTQALSGETRKAFVADMYRACVQTQRVISWGVAEAVIARQCSCVSEKMADLTTFQQLSSEPSDADLRYKAQTAENACRQ